MCTTLLHNSLLYMYIHLVAFDRTTTFILYYFQCCMLSSWRNKDLCIIHIMMGNIGQLQIINAVFTESAWCTCMDCKFGSRTWNTRVALTFSFQRQYKCFFIECASENNLLLRFSMLQLNTSTLRLCMKATCTVNLIHQLQLILYQLSFSS